MNKITSKYPRALKALGQNFLIDQEICDQIVYSTGKIDHSIIVEIGPGCGFLTQSILALTKGTFIFAIEKDKRFEPYLKKLQEQYQTRLNLLFADGLEINYLSFLNKIKKENNHKENCPVHIVANLPYNIASQLLLKWLDQTDLFSTITVMVQSEVAERIISNQSLSWLNIIASIYWEKEIIMNLGPESFWPRPKVNSSIIRLTAKKDIFPHNKKILKKICDKVMKQKRKKITNSLSNLTSDILTNLKIDSGARPADITIEQYCKLSLLLNSI